MQTALGKNWLVDAYQSNQPVRFQYRFFTWHSCMQVVWQYLSSPCSCFSIVQWLRGRPNRMENHNKLVVDSNLHGDPHVERSHATWIQGSGCSRELRRGFFRSQAICTLALFDGSVASTTGCAHSRADQLVGLELLEHEIRLPPTEDYPCSVALVGNSVCRHTSCTLFPECSSTIG